MSPVQKFRSFYQQRSVDNLFRLDGAVPISRAIPLGLQHILAMFVSNIIPIILCMTAIGLDGGATPEVMSNGIRAATMMAAIGTIIQLFPIWRIGARLPVILGTSFTFLSASILVGSAYGLSTLFLSIIIGGVLIGILGLFAHKWRRFIKPIVSAAVIIGLGLSLLEVGISDFLSLRDLGISIGDPYPFETAWPYLVVASVTLITCVAWQCLAKGMWKNISILAGLLVGFITALCFIPYLNMFDFSRMAVHSIGDVINVPRPFFTLVSVSIKDFKIGAILTFILIYLIGATETFGSAASLTEAGFGRAPTDQEISGCIAANGFVSALAGLFGAMPFAVYTQNVALVGQNKVVNRFAFLHGAVILLIGSLFPIVYSFFLSIPTAVIGGAMIMLFASILIIGMKMIALVGFNTKNVTILSLAVGIGYGITLVPGLFVNTYGIEFLEYLWVVLKNPVANMFIIAFILSYIIPDSINKEEPI